MPAPETAPAAARSAIMRAIKPTRTKPEEALAAALESLGLLDGFTRNDPTLPGKPDFAHRGKRFAAFVDGAFWHGKGRLPKANREWWREKLRRNVARDRRADRALVAMKWKPWRIDAGFVLRRPEVAALLIWRELEKR